VGTHHIALKISVFTRKGKNGLARHSPSVQVYILHHQFKYISLNLSTGCPPKNWTLYRNEIKIIAFRMDKLRF
jgi:hypothetical protein